jgi:integrase
VRLAIAIAALAPKLRRTNILSVEWAKHLDPALRYITVVQHKTAEKTGRPLVIPVTDQLRSILLDARRRNPQGTHIVTYRGKAIKDLRGALRRAMEQAGVPYGRYTGATFHTLRHTAATMLAEMEVPLERRKDVMGHENLATTDWYTISGRRSRPRSSSSCRAPCRWPIS